jgi:Tfp pilus assembly pilus retraction ATPase PilT
MSYEMNDLLSLVVEEGASDLHIQVGQSPTLRLHGEMIPVEGPKLTGEDTEALVMAITSEERMQEVKTTVSGECSQSAWKIWYCAPANPDRPLQSRSDWFSRYGEGSA